MKDLNPSTFLNTFHTSSAIKKLEGLNDDIEKALRLSASALMPTAPARDVKVVDLSAMPEKQGMDHKDGQMRLVHDLAHIEMQAMELGLRTLAEFPEAPQEFKEQLISVILDESRHLRMLLDCLEQGGRPWGSFPVHLGLWHATSSEDDLLDRILIVHRYLEGSGLDAGDKIVKKLWGSGQKSLFDAVKIIVKEEVDHVSFGSRWFKSICEDQKLDPDQHFKNRMSALHQHLPKRVLKLNRKVRAQAGFTEFEMDVLESLR